MKQFIKKGKGLLALCLCLCMMGTMIPVTMFPVTVQAADSVPCGSLAVVGDTNSYTYSDNTLTITGSEALTISGNTTTEHIVVAENVTANVTLSGATIQFSDGDSSTSTAGTCAFLIFSGAAVNMTLTGENILQSGYYCAGLQVEGALVITEESTGSLTSKGGSEGAGIGGGDSGAGGSIEISGGTVSATGGDHGAGIGGGDSGAGGNIKISGGTVTAKSTRYGAGIGGGDSGAGGSIEISGGTVSATGGENGAGIGGGYCGQGGSIEISGGTVKASGDYQGAGIGGGYFGSGGEITISGGTVTADGGRYGAGIGGGDSGAGGSIVISGGEVVATGGSEGAGIGGGDSGDGGNIVISGGKVTATGIWYGAGIGGGCDGESGTFATQKEAQAAGGSALIFASSISDTSGKEGSWNGIIFERKSGTVYGDATLLGDLTIPEGYTLTIPENASLTIPNGVSLLIPSDVTVTNNGSIENNGTLENNGSLKNNGSLENGGSLENNGGLENKGNIKNSGTIEGNGSVTGNGTNEDTGTPKVEIKLNDAHKWSSFEENAAFELFSKSKKTVTITAADNVTKNPAIAYYLADSQLTEEAAKDSGIEWTDYAGEFSITANHKKIIYAKATDEAGNVTIVNSAGMVVYTDAQQDTAQITYVKKVTGDVTAKVKSNENMVAAVKNGDNTLTEDTDYTVDYNTGDTGVITFMASYLETLAVSSTPYTLTVSYDPMGETYRQAEGNDAPATTEIALTVKNPKLIRVTAPDAMTGVANGTEQTAEALGLPEKVTIETEDTSVTKAKVTWDLETLASGTYDPSVLTSQTFALKGNVTLPENIINPDNVSLATTITVTVDGDFVSNPAAGIAEGTYTKNQQVALSSTTADAEIYYTTDGSEPDRTKGTKYTGPVSITGAEGQSVTTTLKAIAIKAGMQDSEVVTVTYTINLPDTTAPTVEIKTEDNHKWSSFLHTVTFGLFFKNAKNITITASDNVTTSPDIVYYLADREFTEEEIQEGTITWTAYTGEFNITANNKKIVYAKATDEAGNETIVNSEGIVVYTDAAQSTDKITYVKTVTQNVSANVALNGNTVAAVKNGDNTLTEDTDYTVEYRTDGTGVITFKASYLETLPVSSTPYTLTVSYAPMGENYQPAEGNDAPAITEIALTVKETEQSGENTGTETPAGSADPTGPETPTGSTEPTGSETPSGSADPTGPETPTGSTEPTGPETPTGTTAPTGTETPAGTTDPMGPETPTGSTEPTGTELPTGTIEPTGTETPTGTLAPTGTENPTGSTAPTGTTAPSGTVTTSETEAPKATVPAERTKLTDQKTKAVYRVTKSGKTGAEVAYVKCTDTNATAVTIFATVTIDGIQYKVTSIADKAFANNKKLAKVIIGKNIKTIGKKAFYGCKKLKSITLKTTKLMDKNVGSKAWKGICATVTIKVPKSKYDSYKKILKEKGGSSNAKIK